MPRQLDRLSNIEALEKRILKELGAVEMMEKKLLGEEEELLDRQEEVATGVKKLMFLHKIFLQKLAQHKAVFSTLLATGVVLVSRGIWELSAHLPFLSNSIAALVAGIAILILINRYPNMG